MGRAASRQAVPYLQQAADNAAQRHAPHEVIALLTKGLELLTHLPDTPERAQQELALCIPLGNALIAVQGYAAPDVGAVFNRAYALCQHLEDTAHLLAVLHGLHRFYYNSGEWHVARELAGQMVTLAQQSSDPVRHTEAHRALGLVLWYLGEFAPAHAQMEQGLACYDRQQHGTHLQRSGQDDGVLCMGYTALSLWLVGAPAQAHRRMVQTLELAHALAHPFSLTYVLFFAAMLSQFQRQAAVVQERAERLMALAAQQGFPVYLNLGRLLHGWALTVQGQADVGLAQLQQGLASYQATRGVLAQHYFVALLADAHGTCGHRAEGLRLVDEALAAVPRSGRFWEAELYRQRGDLLRLDNPTARATDAEACFQQAVRIAQRQGARALELRAALSLSRLWQHQGRRVAARALLAPVYGWFTEGFDTADLQDAKALLAELAEASAAVSVER
jgi:predicted ATPase